MASSVRPLAPAKEAAPPARLWTRSFTLICLSTLLCYGSQYFVTPVLPLYVKEFGASTFVVGLVITAFSVVSFVVRPWMGHLTDSWSIVGVMLIGSLILGVTAPALLVPVLSVTFVANAIRGIGWGAINTAGATAVAVAAPRTRRAEASGTYSVAWTTAQGIAPAVALWLYSTTGHYGPEFLIAGLLGGGSALVMLFMPPMHTEASSGPARFSLLGAGFSVDAFIDRRVLLASFILLSGTMTTTAAVAFVPLYALSLDIEDIGLYFVVNGAVAIASRLVLGRYLDRSHRGVWIVAGMLLSIVGFGILSMAESLPWFIAGGIVNSLGLSFSQPSLMAVAMDRADPSHMGKAMATFSMFYRVGEAIGAPLSGLLMDHFGASGMYHGAILSIFLGLALTAANWSTLRALRHTSP